MENNHPGALGTVSCSVCGQVPWVQAQLPPGRRSSLVLASRPGTAMGALATCCHGVSCFDCGRIWMAAEETFSVPALTSGLAAASSTLWVSAVSHSTR